MSSTPEVRDLDGDLADDATRYVAICQQIDDLSKTRDELKARWRSQGAGVFRVGGRDLFTVEPPAAAFDPKKAARILPADVLVAISAMRPDPAKAREVLPPALYAQCCTDKAAAVKTA